MESYKKRLQELDQVIEKGSEIGLKTNSKKTKCIPTTKLDQPRRPRSPLYTCSHTLPLSVHTPTFNTAFPSKVSQVEIVAKTQNT